MLAFPFLVDCTRCLASTSGLPNNILVSINFCCLSCLLLNRVSRISQQHLNTNLEAKGAWDTQSRPSVHLFQLLAAVLQLRLKLYLHLAGSLRWPNSS